MRVLFDQGTPAPLRTALVEHDVVTAHEKGWSQLQNGDLITAAEQSGFEVFVTTDKNLKYQQNLSGRSIAIVVLLTTRWPRIQSQLPSVVTAINQAQRGSYCEVNLFKP